MLPTSVLAVLGFFAARSAALSANRVNRLAVRQSSIPATPTKPDNGITTPQPAQKGMVDNCNHFYKVEQYDYCYAIAAEFNVTPAQLAQWNTDIGGEACTNLWAGYYICVGVLDDSTSPDPDPDPTTTPTPKPNPTPQPVQPGMVDNCNRWHLVGQGEVCGAIAQEVGVTVAQLAEWNKGIGGLACNNMWAGFYLCTGVSG
ncbi:hypothetical protein PG996_009907 [Apiospora saccharicola]|uniref:LysM domain-containing protein n=1 Tax=Apiospora saccharicola TaxID=335842 RepID=A0ABR1UMS2_9PEZI